MRNLIVDIKRTWTGSPLSLITLAEAKKQCVVDHSLDDTLITELISACINEVENWCSISIVPQTVTFVGDLCSGYTLPYGPVLSVSAVQTRDSEQGSGIPTYTTLESGWGISGDEFSLFPGSSFTVRRYPYYRYRIVYSAGMEEISYSLKKTILNLIAFRYEHRGDHEEDLSDDLKTQLNSFKDFSWL